MTKADLIQVVSHDARTTKEQTARVLAALAEAIRCAVSRGESVTVPGIVAVSIRARAARMGRNPATGEPMTIPAKRAVVVKPVAALRNAAL